MSGDRREGGVRGGGGGGAKAGNRGGGGRGRDKGRIVSRQVEGSVYRKQRQQEAVTASVSKHTTDTTENP